MKLEHLKLLAYVDCVKGHVASRTSNLQDGLSWVVVTVSLRDIWVGMFDDLVSCCLDFF